MTVSRHPVIKQPQQAAHDQSIYNTVRSIGVGTFLVYKTADQTAIASGATITFDAADYDPSGWFDLANEQWKPQQWGYYRLSSMIELATANIGTYKHYEVTLYKNGSAYTHMGHAQSMNPANNDDDLQLYGSVIVEAKPGDYFELKFFHNNGATNPTLPAPVAHEHNFFCGEFISFRGAE